MSTTTESPLAPLAHCNIDQANNLLRQGVASKQHAEAYVAAWNASPRHLTTARLDERLISNGCIAPFITNR